MAWLTHIRIGQSNRDSGNGIDKALIVELSTKFDYQVDIYNGLNGL